MIQNLGCMPCLASSLFLSFLWLECVNLSRRRMPRKLNPKCERKSEEKGEIRWPIKFASDSFKIVNCPDIDPTIYLEQQSASPAHIIDQTFSSVYGLFMDMNFLEGMTERCSLKVSMFQSLLWFCKCLFLMRTIDALLVDDHFQSGFSNLYTFSNYWSNLITFNYYHLLIIVL